MTALVSVPTLVRICRVAGKSKDRHRKLYVMIPPASPLVLATVKLVIALAPRTWKMLNILCAIFEAFAFWSFLNLLLSFIRTSAGDVATALTQVQPVRVWCCIYRKPCMGDVRLVKALVWTFMIVVVLVSCLELADDWAHEHDMLLSLASLATLIGCVVAELALIRMGAEIFGERGPHTKFWTMKGLFVASTMSTRVFRRFVTSDVVVGSLCYSRETLVAAWSGGCTALVAFLVAVLASQAFSPRDLSDEAADVDKAADVESPRPRTVEISL